MITPTLPTEGSASALLRGLSLPLRAFSVIVKTPKLLALSLLCAVVTGATLLGTAVGAWSLGQSLSGWLIGAEEGWKHVAAVGLGAVFFIVLFAAGALTLPNLLLAPLQDPLSEATEERCGDFSPPPFSVASLVSGTWSSLRHTLARVALMALGFVVLLPLNLIPVAGNVVYLALSSPWAMFWLAVEHLSNPMARHLRPFRQVLGVLVRRKALALGFGAALYVLLWIPVVNFFLMPLAVVAGTLLYRALLAVNAFPPPGTKTELGRSSVP